MYICIYVEQKRSRRVEDRKLVVITRLSCPNNSINARRNVKDVVCVFTVYKESRRINAKRQKAFDSLKSVKKR